MASAWIAPVASATTKFTLTASPGIGVVELSWSSVASPNVTYSVLSSPSGRSCQVVAQLSCTIVATEAVPWIFRVSAIVKGTVAARSAWTKPLKRRFLVIVAGQSNALGFSSYAVDPETHINYFAAPYTNRADSNDLLDWLPWNLKKMSGGGPVPLDSPQIVAKKVIFGPEIGIARTLASDVGVSATFIKATYFSTSLAKNWRPSNKGGLYVSMVRRVFSLMQSDAQHGQLDVIGAFVWYQGESDAVAGGFGYRQQLAGFLGHLRRDLPISAHAEFVLVKESLAQLIAFQRHAHSCGRDNCQRIANGDALVRSADDAMAATMRSVTTVDSLGVDRTKSSYFVHLSNVGELELGRLVAEAFEKTLV